LAKAFVMGPALRQKSAKMTVPPGLQRRANCWTNLLQRQRKGAGRGAGLCVST
jgi:hypothetical protein